MKNTMTKIKYIFKVLKYVVCCVFYMTFYNLLDSVKLPPKMQGNDKVFPGGHASDSPRFFSGLRCSVYPSQFSQSGAATEMRNTQRSPDLLVQSIHHKSTIIPNKYHVQANI